MQKLVKGVKKQEADRKARTAAMYQKLDAAKKKKPTTRAKAKPKAKPVAKGQRAPAAGKKKQKRGYA